MQLFGLPWAEIGLALVINKMLGPLQVCVLPVHTVPKTSTTDALYRLRDTTPGTHPSVVGPHKDPRCVALELLRVVQEASTYTVRQITERSRPLVSEGGRVLSCASCNPPPFFLLHRVQWVKSEVPASITTISFRKVTPFKELMLQSEEVVMGEVYYV